MLCNINGIHDRIMDNNIINFFQEMPKPAIFFYNLIIINL